MWVWRYGGWWMVDWGVSLPENPFSYIADRRLPHGPWDLMGSPTFIIVLSFQVSFSDPDLLPYALISALQQCFWTLTIRYWSGVATCLLFFSSRFSRSFDLVSESYLPLFHCVYEANHIFIGSGLPLAPIGLPPLEHVLLPFFSYLVLFSSISICPLRVCTCIST